jgi:hypothetical protein
VTSHKRHTDRFACGTRAADEQGTDSVGAAGSDGVLVLATCARFGQIEVLLTPGFALEVAAAQRASRARRGHEGEQ